MKLLASLLTLSALTPVLAKIDFLPTPWTPGPSMPAPTTQAQTLVWSTQTLANGQKTTIQVPYTQVFTQRFVSVDVPPAGSVGLGKWSSNGGKVGVVKPTQYLTVTTARSKS
ncbi:hypothetical protein AWJ20_1741 [Sugiyamaella lignohabitans]|uniref:Uncharacterized protein n=1 Tax=Sugiyamaella lignohabitans TaxID=796027 RepID=A0A167DYQ9_9ASCO|nr:uncharacterized protein AWJ20_1741 [Sugiyamaella lignohabitans]ANB13450.1 hypothetical protein AWJ20_1741 [Sugiyamaella lignohabitans]